MIKSWLVNRDRVKIIIYLIVISCSIGICLLGIRINAKQQHQRKIEYAEATVENEAVKIKQLNKQVRQFYRNDEQEFLTDSIKESSIKEVEGQIAAVKYEAEDFGLNSKEFSTGHTEIGQRKIELTNSIKNVRKKYTIQNEITKLLVQGPTDWSVKDETLVISEEATAEKITRIREKLSGNTGAWHDAITLLLDEIDTQVTQYSELEKSINLMREGEELTSNANSENYILNYNQLELIKNETLRNRLSDKLDIIGKLLDNIPVNVGPNVIEEEVLLPESG
ncbi:hypothetical protein UAW_00183 [Enterococcus haemoperoxidus ATCC BAA-382]|uniref:MapZ extracellular domain-containing protein n=1 Tax=Enterococcus haemoperoxidus ATCC BAA-382 TaxID=1158608 RepID=R2T573_9ENTE|nr:hypothetical protein [Enterococcus haemoperoxidus]EOI00169.1 hypothetical protein UAW_00183 [Enterococcus haemoperoxidus ATCC BAA-382]EOT59593.1 hypothetical protein I583_02228 [Enterococcus haemoperoxidus ATCC BAA-382]